MSQYKEQLKEIPSKDDLIAIGIVKETREVLDYVVKEFKDDEGGYMPFLRVSDTVDAWKWYIELPFAVSVLAQHSVRDALAEKAFDIVHFNGHNSFADGYTRMSLTILKGAS